MKILITGGCGFVGSNLAIYFKNNRIGTKINTLDNLSRKGSLLNLVRLKKNKIKNFKKDISNYSSLKNLPKYDLIVDCCAEAAVEVSKKEIDKVFNTNLVGTLNILKKCTKDRSNFIFLSSSRVYSIKDLRKLTVGAYKINEFVGEKLMAYNPIPGEQKGCVDLNEASGGIVWSGTGG